MTAPPALPRSILVSKARRALKAVPTLADILSKTNGWL